MKYKVGIIRETRVPADNRVPLTPSQIIGLHKLFPKLEIFLQPSPIRCFSDIEYKSAGIKLKEDLSDCHVIMGIKEISPDLLFPNKTYIFFSHTGKNHFYNKDLLKTVIKKRITLYDYEFITDATNNRLIAFGYWAGIVGTYNIIRSYGLKHKLFKIKPPQEYSDLNSLFFGLGDIKLPDIKILITGEGRAALGAVDILEELKVRRVIKDQYLHKTYSEPVYCQIGPEHYVYRINGQLFHMTHFKRFPNQYKSNFKQYCSKTDIYIACHYWDSQSPVFISKKDLKATSFKIDHIADISCDIGKPIAPSIKHSQLDNPFYGYHKKTGTITSPFDTDAITVMSIDNLSNGLPRESSEEFGKRLIKYLFPSLLGEANSDYLIKAAISKSGILTEKFEYLYQKL